MEDTGYMARAAFIMDKIMHAIGLHGKSFIPLFMALAATYLQLWQHEQSKAKPTELLPC
jgi:ferrous iron transport protein B